MSAPWPCESTTANIIYNHIVAHLGLLVLALKYKKAAKTNRLFRLDLKTLGFT
jgi:hypothetical protein